MIQLINNLSILLVLYVIIIYLKNLFVNYTLLNKYKIYIDLFNHFAEESFQMIYKDQIISYSVSGFTIQGDELETAKRNYIKLFFEIIGITHEKNLVVFFGKRETLIQNLLMYFQKKVEDDEIMKLLNSKHQKDK